MKKLVLFTVVMATIICCGKNEHTEIRELFDSFNKANMEMDGETVYKLSDSASHAYYAKLLKLVLVADSTEIEKLDIIDKINVLTARYGINDSAIKNMSEKDFMVKMYSDVNVMDDNKVKAMKMMRIKDVVENGDQARGELAPGGRSMPQKVYVDFFKEGDSWKYNIPSVFEFTKEQLEQMCNQAGLSENDFLNLVLSDPMVEEKAARPLGAIWSPIQ